MADVTYIDTSGALRTVPEEVFQQQSVQAQIAPRFRGQAAAGVGRALTPEQTAQAANQDLLNELLRRELLNKLHPAAPFDPTIAELLSGSPTIDLGGGPRALPGGPGTTIPGIEVQEREGIPTFATQPQQPGTKARPQPLKPDLKLSELAQVQKNIQGLPPDQQEEILSRLTGRQQPTVELGGGERVTPEGLSETVAPRKFKLSEIKNLVAQTQGLPADAQTEVVGKFLGVDFTQEAMQRKIQELNLQAQKELQVDEIKRGRAEQQKLNAPLGAESRLWLLPDGTPVNPAVSTYDAIKMGAIPQGEAQLTGTASAISAKQQIGQYASLIDSLNFPKVQAKAGEYNWSDMANVAQNALKLQLRYFGGDPEVRKLIGMYGMIANIARGTGDTANIAVAEREMLKNSLVTFWESQDSAYAVINQANQVIEAVLKARGFPVQAAEYKPAEEYVLPGGQVVKLPARRVLLEQSPEASKTADDSAIEALIQKYSR